MYSARRSHGTEGELRHAIWSDVLECVHCHAETSYWDAAVRYSPLRLIDRFKCHHCKKFILVNECTRAVESVRDDILKQQVTSKQRIPVRVYGQTGKVKWQREPNATDLALLAKIDLTPLPRSVPKAQLQWGDLHRRGYHTGITHLHHFYTRRNFFVLNTLWELADTYSSNVRDALKLLILSYNASHATLMSRVVVKNGDSDFVLTGAQSGVLYVSGLPVEKNIIKGITRKATALSAAFALVHASEGNVRVVNSSSESLDLSDASIDYVFTDPPFGDYIPYAEVNQLNELWLGSTTDQSKRSSSVIRKAKMSPSMGK